MGSEGPRNKRDELGTLFIRPKFINILILNIRPQLWYLGKVPVQPISSDAKLCIFRYGGNNGRDVIFGSDSYAN